MDFGGAKTVTEGSLKIYGSMEEYRFAQLQEEISALRREVVMLRQHIENGEDNEDRRSSSDHP